MPDRLCLGTRILLLMTATHILVSTAQAGVTTYTDRNAFSAAAGPTRLITFTTLPDSSVPIDPAIPDGLQDMSFSGVCFENVYHYYYPPPNQVFFIYTYPQNILRADLPPGTYALGVDLEPYYPFPGTYTVTLSTGQAYQLTEPGFFGVISTTPVSWITAVLDTTYLIFNNFAFTASAGSVASCPPPVFTPPTITAVASNPGILWPPDNKMIPVSVSATTSGGNGAVSCKITSVSSNEPIDRGGDWVITGDLSLNLKAERLGNGNGRIYTLTITCTDKSNNSTSKNVTVIVPHDQGTQ